MSIATDWIHGSTPDTIVRFIGPPAEMTRAGALHGLQIHGPLTGQQFDSALAASTFCFTVFLPRLSPNLAPFEIRIDCRSLASTCMLRPCSPKSYSATLLRQEHRLVTHFARSQRQRSSTSVAKRHVLCRASWWPFEGQSMSGQSLSLADRIAITTKEYDGYKRSFPEV